MNINRTPALLLGAYVGIMGCAEKDRAEKTRELIQFLTTDKNCVSGPHKNTEDGKDIRYVVLNKDEEPSQDLRAGYDLNTDELNFVFANDEKLSICTDQGADGTLDSCDTVFFKDHMVKTEDVKLWQHRVDEVINVTLERSASCEK